MVDLVCCGAINWDINLFMERLPRTGEEVSVGEIQRVSGGPDLLRARRAPARMGRPRIGSFLQV